MPGRVFKRGEIYWIAFYCKGTEYRLSAKTEKKRTAEEFLSFYLGQVARGEFQGFTPNGIQFSVTSSILVCCEKSLLMRFQKDL